MCNENKVFDEISEGEIEVIWMRGAQMTVNLSDSMANTSGRQKSV